MGEEDDSLKMQGSRFLTTEKIEVKYTEGHRDYFYIKHGYESNAFLILSALSIIFLVISLSFLFISLCITSVLPVVNKNVA